MKSFIAFAEVATDRPGKTKQWVVKTSDEFGLILGFVRWYTSWRKYCYAPLTETVYEEQCLREIADFVAARTAEQRATWKRRT